MSESNNNFNVREIARQSNSRVNSFQSVQRNQRATEDEYMDSEGEDIILESYRRSIMNRECGRNLNMPVSCADVLDNYRPTVAADEQPYVPLPSPWPVGRDTNQQVRTRSQINQTMEETSSESDSESELELIFEEEIPVYDMRFYNPNYPYTTVVPNGNMANPTGIFLHNPTNLPVLTQVNTPRFQLRPVPGSIELTRNQHRNTWNDYRPRVRASARNRRRGANRNRRTCTGPPPNQMPMYMDEELGSIVFIRNDSESEEECTPPPLALVPRRGNSVSDLSQCSSDEEPHSKKPSM